MKLIAKLAILPLFLYSCQNAPVKEEAQNPNEITDQSIGPVKVSFTKNDLLEKFGKEELQDEEREIDGVKRETTRVYPNKPEEVTVVWEDNTEEKPLKLIIWNENGPYATKEGLRLGISLRDVVKLNNFLSVSFTNFYQELDGYANILSFNNGEIEEKYPSLTGRLDIVRLKGVDKYKLDDFKLKDSVNSSDPIVQSMDVKITEISISGDSKL